MHPGSDGIVRDILGRAWSDEDTALRTAVCNRLHYTSTGAAMSDAHWFGVRMLADGFGDLTCLPACVAQECIGDWSHVRDSSPEAFRAMHAYLVAGGLL